MIDLPFWDLGFDLAANVNNPEFQEHSRQITIELAKFMQENGMLKETMLEDGTEPPDNFVIYESDLTELGRAMQSDLAFDRWLRANENITKPISMRSLVRSLKKLTQE